MPELQTKKRYSKITYTKRLKLIELIEKQGKGVSQAARQLRIKIPTAKVILRNYRNKGRIYMKKSDQILQSLPTSHETLQMSQQNSDSDLNIVVQQEIAQPQPINFYPILNWILMPNYDGMVIF